MAYAGGAVAAAAAIANAIKASGVLITVEQNDFIALLSKAEKPLVVTSSGGMIKKNYQYLMSYKGFVFYTKTPSPIILCGKAEIITAQKIWIPR
jgi:hypothetical protein